MMTFFSGLRVSALCLSATCVLLLTGCKPDAAIRKGETVGAGTAAPTYDPMPDAASTGTLTGTVLFSGAAPARVPIDMSQDPACSLTGGANLSEQYVVDHGKLANVFVYVKNAPHLQTPGAPVPMNQKGCRFTPHVVAVAVGGTVQFTNSDPTMHNVHTMAVQSGNRSIDVSQAPGAPAATLTYNAAENMVPVRCNNHPWMNGFVNVSPNTFFAVSGSDGSFTIPNLPQGTYTVAFVHEKLGEQDMQVTVKPQARTPITATFKRSNA